MSLLHSFYCWGTVAVILISTLFFNVFGISNWKWMACIWAILPLYNIYNFMTCPIEYLVEDGQGMSVRELLKSSLFWTGIILMICAGASEISMSQWASAFTESALGIEKRMGDLAGPCMFAVMQGVSRVIYGKYGNRIDLTKYMMGSGALCLICYILASVSHNPLLSLVGCIMCGFSVGIMWPGTISIMSKRLPVGGTAMFALLAMAGDIGGSVGPAAVGIVTQSANDNLQVGMLSASVFPFVLIMMLLLMRRQNKRGMEA